MKIRRETGCLWEMFLGGMLKPFITLICGWLPSLNSSDVLQLSKFSKSWPYFCSSFNSVCSSPLWKGFELWGPQRLMGSVCNLAINFMVYCLEGIFHCFFRSMLCLISEITGFAAPRFLERSERQRSKPIWHVLDQFNLARVMKKTHSLKKQNERKVETRKSYSSFFAKLGLLLVFSRYCQPFSGSCWSFFFFFYLFTTSLPCRPNWILVFIISYIVTYTSLHTWLNAAFSYCKHGSAWYLECQILLQQSGSLSFFSFSFLFSLKMSLCGWCFKIFRFCWLSVCFLYPTSSFRGFPKLFFCLFVFFFFFFLIFPCIWSIVCIFYISISSRRKY